MARPVIVRVGARLAVGECIMLWSGSVATIPTGYRLCDGTGGTVDLRDKFVRGTNEAELVGTAAGYSDTATMTHAHTPGFRAAAEGEPAHEHTMPEMRVLATHGNSADLGVSGPDVIAPHDDHVWPEGGRTSPYYQLPAASHRHYGTGESTTFSSERERRPPFYALCYVQGPLDGVPVGGIVLYSGSLAAVPAGFRICDGTGGTPNLRDRFVVGAGGIYLPWQRGGSQTIDATHTHTAGSLTIASESAHCHVFPPYIEDAVLPGVAGHISYIGYTGGYGASHTHLMVDADGMAFNEDNPLFSTAGEAHDHAVEMIAGTRTYGDGYYCWPLHVVLAYIQRMS